MYAKMIISGEIELETGMHIGGSSAFSAIGAVDLPIIRDARGNLPMIPGSSLKGKMRSLLARKYNERLDARPDQDYEGICRLFGSASGGGKGGMKARPARLLFPDLFLTNADELRRSGAQGLTEVKFENSINRLTAVANPRQIERAIRGSVFGMGLVYEIRQDVGEEEVIEDMGLLADGFRLLQLDYLGGHGSRGYGKVRFKGVSASCAIGELTSGVLEKCNGLLNAAIS